MLMVFRFITQSQVRLLLYESFLFFFLEQKKKAPSSDQLDTNFITQLLCDNISQKQPLDGECTLEQILQVSKSLVALSSSLGRDHSRFLSNSFASKAGTSSSTSSSDLSPHDDGYFALTLRIKSLNIQGMTENF